MLMVHWDEVLRAGSLSFSIALAIGDSNDIGLNDLPYLCFPGLGLNGIIRPNFLFFIRR